MTIMPPARVISHFEQALKRAISMPQPIQLSYHGRTYPAEPCGTFGRRRTPIYWLQMASSSAIVKAGPARASGTLASSVLTHSGTSASFGQFDRNMTKIAWGDHPAAKAWAAKQCREHAKHQTELAARAQARFDERLKAAQGLADVDMSGADRAGMFTKRAETFTTWATELEAGVPQAVDNDVTAVDGTVWLDAEPETFRDAVLEAHDALGSVPDATKGWQDAPATVGYMRTLSRAADRADAPKSARLELDDLFGDVMVGRHPTGAAADHGRRLLMLIADRSADADEVGKFAQWLQAGQPRNDYAAGEPGADPKAVE